MVGKIVYPTFAPTSRGRAAVARWAHNPKVLGSIPSLATKNKDGLTLSFCFMYTVYILYSFTHHKTYVGFTSDLINRFKTHNELGTSGWTLRYRLWMVLHTEIFESKTEGMKREKELKSGKGREWINTNLPSWKLLFR